MAHFLLIHGASHGAWCWSRLIPHLEALGHSARAIDLPSHGDDPSAPETVRLSDYVSACVDSLEDDTILVGHSLGGLTVTLAAAQSPEKVKCLVYLCALVPVPGQSFAHIRKGAIAAALQEIMTVDRERGISTVDPSKAGPVFYHDCTPEDVDFATKRLSPQPIDPLGEIMEFDAQGVPRHYIRCLDDRTVNPSYQRDASSGWPAGTVHEIASGHSPFFSHPVKLAQILGEIAAS